MFDVGRSMFNSFFFDLTGRLRPAAALIRNFANVYYPIILANDASSDRTDT
jgi:hypothetical protein